MAASEQVTKELDQLLSDFNYGKFTLDQLKVLILGLMKKGADLKQQDTSDNKYTVLHHLVFKNKDGALNDFIIQLLGLSPDLVHAIDGSGNTPLQALITRLAKEHCKIGDIKQSAMLLVEHGASLAEQDTKKYGAGGTFFHHLVLTNKQESNMAEITTLLKKTPNPVDFKDKSGNTPLQALLTKLANGYCCTIDDIKQLAMLLVEHGANFAEQDAGVYGEGGTLLHHLVLTNEHGCNMAEITTLLEKTPNPVNFKDKSGNTPLQALITRLANEQCTISDIKQSAMLLVEYGASLAGQDRYKYGDGGTLLHHLVLTNERGVNNAEITKLLEKQPEAIEFTDKNNATVLQELMTQRIRRHCDNVDFKQSAMLLVQHGADLTKRDSYKYGEGSTLLHHLVLINELGKYDEDIEQLLKGKPDLINATTNSGCTPLQDFLSSNIVSVDGVEKLLRLGSNPHHVDENGRTLLHSLFNYSTVDSTVNSKVAKVLIRKGLDIKAKTKDGSSMWHLTWFNNTQPFNSGAYQWFYDQGLDINATNNEGKTALHLATENNNVPMIDWLLQHQANPIITDAQGKSACATPVENKYTPHSQAIQIVEAQISNELKQLQKKADIFQKNGKTDAWNAAHTLHTKLSASFDTYKAAPFPKSKEVFEQFKRKCDSAIFEARPELSKHRSLWWNNFTANLTMHIVLLACTLGIGNVVALSYNLAQSGGKSMFFKMSTKSEQQINRIEETVEQFGKQFPQ